MNETRKLKELSRQQLYDLIWSKPIAEVATEYGITEATVKNYCNNRRVPRPSRRYWRAIEVGGNPHKKPLPNTDQETFEIIAKRPIPKNLSLPEPGNELHPLAAEMLAALDKLKSESASLIRLEDPRFPHTRITKALARQTVQAFEVVFRTLAAIGIEYKKFPGKHEPGFFRWGQDRLYLYIEEMTVDSTGTEKKYYDWGWHTRTRPSGHLIFTTKTDRWNSRESKDWAVSHRHPIERVLAELVKGIQQHFLDLQRKRDQEAIESKKQMEEYWKRHRVWLAEETIRKQKEAEKAHAAAIVAMAEARKSTLIRSAQGWEKSERIKEYIEECERRWKASLPELNLEQTAWLAWARAIAEELSPFAKGYPEPTQHGAFDAATIPFGGPYPGLSNNSKPE